jgi:hypothetical protein
VFNIDSFLSDLDTFIRFRTCVDQNQREFAAARAWIQAFFDPAVTTFETFTFEGYTSLLIKPRASELIFRHVSPTRMQSQIGCHHYP